MSIFREDKYLKNLDNRYILIILFINLIFFFITFDNPWTLDDYGYFLSAKLYNLTNDQLISFEPFVFGEKYSFHSETRYLPLFYLLNQLMPDSNVVFHLVVVSIHALTCLIVFLISKKIFKENFSAFATAVFYTLNYSISIKALSWNIFYGHILSAFFGFLAVFVGLYISKLI